MGSKYVQSESPRCLQSDKDLFKKAIAGFCFTGSPCASRRAKGFFYIKPYENLPNGLGFGFCHAVPSPLIYRQYINMCSGRNLLAKRSCHSQHEVQTNLMRWSHRFSYCFYFEKRPRKV